MSLDTYENLKTAIGAWTRRKDLNVVIDDVIDLCEASIYANPEQPLRCREMEVRATASTSTADAYLALPDRFLSMRRLILTYSDVSSEVAQRTPETMPLNRTAGRPYYFTVTSQITFDRTSDVIYTAEMLYHAKPVALAPANTTNAILTSYPNIYLYGCRWAAYDYAGEEDKANENYTKFISAIKGANRSSDDGNYGPAPQMSLEESIA